MLTLGARIVANREQLVRGWEEFARSLLPGAAGLSDEELRDSIPDLLDALAASLDRPDATDPHSPLAGSQTGTPARRLENYSRSHADTRLAQGFGLEQVISEYAALRVDVLQRCGGGSPIPEEALAEWIAFDRSMDRCLYESVAWFIQGVSSARDLMLGVLGHDLRSPLAAISTSATVLLHDQRADPRTTNIAARVLTSATRMSRMIRDLLDFARTRMGHRLPIVTSRIPLRPLLSEAVEEMRAALPDALIHCSVEGPLEGDWDPERISQLLANLIANAYQHGDATRGIDVCARSDGEVVVISVHNAGAPIPENVRRKLFEPLMHGASTPQASVLAGSVGLGLYISREIALAHGGDIDVESSLENGTTFSVRMPVGLKERRH